ncbi:unnamed protein product [Paramecium pentaurelia]|uniref:YbaK/aminoacyl-tRNA synthetase-associated domain-containing protein n=1 Tax=Paramecium pentaurelia TaxID=43138 RepID=A0A8S1VGV7_9CILI|nr:unnamed protein product [Paramecium pentaurelia]
MIQNEIAECMKKMTTYLDTNGYKKFKLFQAQPNYFDLNYQERKELLQAPSIDYLCKSIIMENTKYDDSYPDHEVNPKYICVVVQYITKLQGEKINKYFKQLQNQKYPDKQISRNKLHFRLTSDEMSYQLSGYQFNAITPFNMVQNMPLLISDRILNLEYIWFGGGHTDVKLRMDIKEMCTLYPNKVYYTDIIMPQQE